MTPDELAERLSNDPLDPEVALVVLFGSRARGDGHEGSDWDLGYLAGPAADIDMLAALLSDVIDTDKVDLVDLRSATALLRYRCARDGVALWESDGEAFLRFRLEATLFWCDVEFVVRAAHADVLSALG